jgi:hypothetical protein
MTGTILYAVVRLSDTSCRSLNGSVGAIGLGGGERFADDSRPYQNITTI